MQKRERFGSLSVGVGHDLGASWQLPQRRGQELRVPERIAPGDARCTVQIEISRARIVATVTDKDTKFAVPAHTAHCIVEQAGELKTVKATLAP